ncbi:MAG: polysaccharide biosynthesis/export family protein [Sphingobacterium sp.]|nr:polysaccharide biosynthesis/export family protein [Sphingobacterium sp.]
MLMLRNSKQQRCENLIKGHISNLKSRKYILAPNDVINIIFPTINELSQEEIRTKPDGIVLFPLIGSIDVSGHTIEELRRNT